MPPETSAALEDHHPDLLADVRGKVARRNDSQQLDPAFGKQREAEYEKNQKHPPTRGVYGDRSPLPRLSGRRSGNTRIRQTGPVAHEELFVGYHPEAAIRDFHPQHGWIGGRRGVGIGLAHGCRCQGASMVARHHGPEPSEEPSAPPSPETIPRIFLGRLLVAIAKDALLLEIADESFRVIRHLAVVSERA